MNAFRWIISAVGVLTALVLLTSVPARAEIRSFPGWQVDLPEGWALVEERDADFGGDGFYRVVLQAEDGRTRLEIMAHYMVGEAASKAILLAELYSLGATPGRVKLGDAGYKVAIPDKARWMAFAALGPDLMMSVMVDPNHGGDEADQASPAMKGSDQTRREPPEDPVVSAILRSIKPADLPEKYRLVRQSAEAAKNEFRSARHLRLAPPTKPGPPPEVQAEFMKLCFNGSPQAIEAAIKAGADPLRGLSDLGWPAVLGYEASGLPNWKTTLIEAGKLVDIYEREVLAKDWDSDYWQVWGPYPAATPLMAAAWGNPDPNSLKVLLKAGADPNVVTSKRMTALGLASAQAGPAIVQALLDGGAVVYDETNRSESALNLAAQYNPDPEVTRLLLDRGARPHPGSIRVSSPIALAAVHNPNLAVLDLLLARLPLRQSDPYEGVPSDLAVLLASEDARPEALRKLLDAGSPIEETAVIHVLSDAAVSPLTVAARFSNNPEVIKILLEAGADPNRRFKSERRPGSGEGLEGLSALSTSVTRNLSAILDQNRTGWNREISETLVQGGAVVSPADLRLATGYRGEAEALKYLIGVWKKQNPEADFQALLNELAAEAIGNTKAELVEVLVEEGADIQAALDEDPELAFVFFTGRHGINPKNMAALGISYKIDPNARAQSGQTPLTKSLDSSNYQSQRNVVADILEAGADPNLADGRTGFTPLLMALNHPNDTSPQVALLLEAGADPNLSAPNGLTPLMLAAGRAEADMVKLLLAAGADVQATDEQGRSALMLAQIPLERKKSFPPSRPGTCNTMLPPPVDKDKVAALLAAGADVHLRDKQGFTALAYAAMAAHEPEIISLLAEAGSNLHQSVGGQTLLQLAVKTNPNPAVISRLAAMGAPLSLEKSTREQLRPVAMMVVRDLGAFFAERIWGLTDWALFKAADRAQAAMQANVRTFDFGDRIYVAEILGLLPDDWPDYEPEEKVGDYKDLLPDDISRPDRSTADHRPTRGAEGELWAYLNSPQDDPLDFYLELRAVVKAGVDLEERDQFGRSPLIYAAQMFEGEMALAVVKQLLAAGARADVRDDRGLGALMYAARFQGNAFLYREMLEALISAGADIEARDPAGHTALMQTVIFEPKAEEALAKVKILHDLGADLNTRDRRGATVLINAALMREIDSDNDKLYKWLMEQGVEAGAVDQGGLNAAMASALTTGGHYSDNFYQGGAEPSARDHQGRDVLTHLLRHRPLRSMSDYTWKKINPDNQADLKRRDIYGLSLPQQVLFSHASLATLKMLLDQGLDF